MSTEPAIPHAAATRSRWSNPSAILEWRVFAVALCAVAAVVTAAWVIAPPVYLTNDDVTIRLGLEGRLVPGQPPTGFVLFPHSILGWTLAGLYTLLPTVPWWDLALTTTLCWALAILGALAWGALGPGWLTRTTAVAAVATAALPLIGTVQFTISSTIAGGAAALGAVLETRRPAGRRRSALAMMAVLFLAGSLIRPMGAVAGALAACGLLVPVTLFAGQTPRWRVRVLGLVGIGLVAGVGFGVLWYLDGLLYGVSPGWREYREYNAMVVALFEWGGALSSAQVNAILSSVGWTANDWQMLDRWWGVVHLHGFAAVTAAYEAGVGMVGTPDAARGFVAGLAAVNAHSVVRLAEASGRLLLIGAVIAAAHGTRRAWATLALVVTLFFWFCVAVEVGFKELPDRLLVPLQGVFLGAMLVSVGELRRTPSPRVAILGLSAVLAALAYEGRAVAVSMAAQDRHSTQVEVEVTQLLALEPSLVIRHGDTLPVEHWWRPFHQPDRLLPMLSLGSNNLNPQLARFLAETDRWPLLETVCADPTILVVTLEGRLSLVTQYFREHRNQEVTWEQVYDDASFPAWRCVAGGSTSRGDSPDETDRDDTRADTDRHGG